MVTARPDSDAISADSSCSQRSTTSELSALLQRTWPLFLGNTLEWYEFAVYGYLAPYLMRDFFSDSDVGVWLGYGASFVTRPFGGLLFGIVADRCGRRPVAVVSLLGMMLATGLQGALPAAGGGTAWSLHALVALRLAQGFFVGGEEGTMMAMLAEEAPHRHKNLVTSLYFTVAFVAFMVTAAVVFVLESVLDPPQMQSWGWRLPFLLVLPLGLVAFWGRRRIEETGDFKQFLQDRASQQGAQEAGNRDRFLAKFEVVRRYSGHVILGCAAAAGFSALFYTASAWTIAFLKARGLQHGSLLAALQQAVLVVLVPCFGRLGDRVGVATMMLAGAALTALAGVPVFAVLESAPANWTVAFLCVGVGYGVPIAVCAAASGLFCAELFPTQGRSLGVGLTHNLAMSLVGGAAGIMAQESLKYSKLGPGVYISAWGALSSLAICAGLAARAVGRAQLAHVRPEPYFCGRSEADGAEEEAKDGEQA